MPEPIEIPAEWQQKHWKTQVALANDIAEANGKGREDGMEASKARAIIEAEARRRAAVEALPEQVKPAVPDDAPLVPLRLIRDTWQGTTRIRADGQVSNWALADAKRLIAEGVAVRADPLPGE